MGVFSGSRSVRDFHSYEGAPNYWNHKYAEEDISIHAPVRERRVSSEENTPTCRFQSTLP
ncbi:hypothetical protein BISU_2278 [Bifidobacterium subtile]|uniref:Uncharacterized protein n=1 Tax=Bifidobacterium subtile TaxID=77635 RepID=A0A087DU75_9BIFI|nr:hypothetical protein BISU_2278 [Bifidobacterium subtile]